MNAGGGRAGEGAREEGTPPVVPVPCWRCGQIVSPAEGKCPRCHAVLEPASACADGPAGRANGSAEASLGEMVGIVRVLIVYGGILLLVIAMGAVLRQLHTAEEVKSGSRAMARNLWHHLAVMEILFSGVVIFGLFWAPRPAPIRKPSRGLAWAAWLASGPILALVLLANVAYHAWLRDIFGIDVDEKVGLDELAYFVPAALMVCVQPAVIEELMFRYLLLGSLLPVTGTHAAVWISALAFGIAHLATPLSVPIFILLGIMLGYARVATGGLGLPILLHLVHNSVILWRAM